MDYTVQYQLNEEFFEGLIIIEGIGNYQGVQTLLYDLPGYVEETGDNTEPGDSTGTDQEPGSNDPSNPSDPSDPTETTGGTDSEGVSTGVVVAVVCGAAGLAAAGLLLDVFKFRKKRRKFF